MAKKSSGAKKADESGIKLIAKNRRASHDYHKLDSIETGIVLFGTEVKSLRDGKVNFVDSYGSIRDDELFVHKLDIPEYTHGNRQNHEPTRSRKLLAHKREILKLDQKIREKGLTLIPWRIYFKAGKVKLEIALAKGKKLYDKREQMAKRDAKREVARAMSRRR